ncbi:hypothetical protein SDC9_34762 [bioreactor metagenome]|uniref:Uncharacterized protein n=1 Tax=bioreactor metagenome TaxID=1076179 RepID=A0A644VC93_9ZZZZ
MGGVLPADLDADIGRVVVEIGDQHLADQLVEMAVLLDHRADPAGEGADEAIGEKDAEEGADQRAADHVAEDLGRLVDRRHRLDHAKHRGDDAKRGHRVGHGLDRVARLHRVLVIGLELLVEDLLDLMRVVVIHRGGAHRVADHLDRLVILHDFRIFLENRRALRRLDMFLDGDGVLPHQPDQLEQQAQQVAIVGGLPGRAAEHLAEVAQRVPDRRKAVRQQERARRGTADHDQLERHRLQDDADLAACRDEAAEHHHEDDDHPDNADHSSLSTVRPAVLRGGLTDAAVQRRGAPAFLPAMMTLIE